MKHNHNHGFSLIEIVIAVSISTVIFLSIAAVFQISEKSYLDTENKAEITQNGRVILDRLSRELRQSEDLVTTLPIDNSNPASLAHEIVFQDGHDLSTISYIRYYLNGSNISRQSIVYYFPSDPSDYVFWHNTDKDGNAPTMKVLEEKVIGEYVDDIEFWGDELISINLYLRKNNQSDTIFTSIYGRNF